MPQHAGVDRWELRTCARRGHVTYAPDDPALAERLSGKTGLGEVWRCLRCGEFTLGSPGWPRAGRRRPNGPAGQGATSGHHRACPRRGTLGACRFDRARGLGGLEVSRRAGIRQVAFDRDMPVLRATGFKVDQMTAVHELEKALATKPSTLILLVVILAAYALLELVEGIGLWLLQRWGEYFAVVATAIFLPLEVHELMKGITPTRAVTFAINVAAVIYLLVSKRLFGLRGGRKAYDDERRGERLLDIERAAMSG